MDSSPASRDYGLVVAASFGHLPGHVPEAGFAQDPGELSAQDGPVACLVVVCLPAATGFADEEQVDRVGAFVHPIPRLEVDSPSFRRIQHARHGGARMLA